MIPLGIQKIKNTGENCDLHGLYGGGGEQRDNGLTYCMVSGGRERRPTAWLVEGGGDGLTAWLAKGGDDVPTA